MKKVLKIIGFLIGGFIALIAIAVLVFWIGWLRAPSPESVCSHLETLAGAETSRSFNMDRCVERFQPPEFGRMPYAKRMKCILRAETMDDTDDC